MYPANSAVPATLNLSPNVDDTIFFSSSNIEYFGAVSFVSFIVIEYPLTGYIPVPDTSLAVSAPAATITSS